MSYDENISVAETMSFCIIKLEYYDKDKDKK